MGLVAGMLDRAYSHGLRRSAARDVAHLSSRALDGVGFTNEGVRQSMGHMSTTMSKGITEQYVGGSSLDM